MNNKEKSKKLIMYSIKSALHQFNGGIPNKTIQQNLIFELENYGVPMINSINYCENLIKALKKLAKNNEKIMPVDLYNQALKQLTQKELSK